MKDVLKVIDFLEGHIATSHHTFVGGRGVKIEQGEVGLNEIEKNHFSSTPL